MEHTFKSTLDFDVPCLVKYEAEDYPELRLISVEVAGVEMDASLFSDGVIRAFTNEAAEDIGSRMADIAYDFTE